MKKTLIAALIAFSSQAAYAEDFNLTDLVPVRANSDISAAKENVRVEGNVVIASNDNDAVQFAQYSLIEDNADGVRMIQVGSGIGILALGTSSYQTYDNLNATLLSKRAAYNRAYLIAKKQLVENMNGLSNSCTTVASIAMEGIDTGNDSVANMEDRSRQSCLESVQGSLAGYVTYDVDDNPEENLVRVSLISTPKTRAQIRGSAGATALTSDPNELFKQVIDDIKSGVVPPVGAKIITNANTGEVIILGYGSAIKRTNSNANVQRRLADQAKRQSQTLARSALIGTLQGSEVYWRGGFDESQTEYTKQFEYDDPYLQDPDHVIKLTNERSAFTNQFSSTDVYNDVSEGKVPAGVNTRTFNSDDGHWTYSVAVYAPSLEVVANQAALETQGGNANTRLITVDGVNEAAANPRGASGTVTKKGEL